MNILVINWRDIKNPRAGGAEVYFQEIFKRIANQGHKVTLFCTGFDNAPKEEVIDGIRIIRKGKELTFNWTVYRNLTNLLEREQYDLIIDDLNKIPFYSPWIVKRKKPVLVILMHLFRNAIFKEVVFPLASYVYLGESLIPLCYKNNNFAVLSESSKKDVLRFGIKEELITVIPPGTDTEKYLPKKDQDAKEKIILHVGRLKKYKSTHHLLYAAKVLKERRKDFRVIIVGDGDDLPRLKKIAKKLELDKIVKFTGFVPEEKKIEYYQNGTLLVENSVKEGWGLIVMEANACGIPVIASRVPGIVDAVKEYKSGFLYEYGNINELVTKIETLLKDTSLCEAMGRAGRIWAKEFTWDNASKKMLEVIERSLSQKSSVGARPH